MFFVATYASAVCSSGPNVSENSSTKTAQTASWATCTQLGSDPVARLACFDRWAEKQTLSPALTGGAAPTQSISPSSAFSPSPVPPSSGLVADTLKDCRNGPHSELSRFWELDAGSDCGRFKLRSYQPFSLSLIESDGVNNSPNSPSPGHTSGEQPYLSNELRIQLSARVKLGSNYLTDLRSIPQDSLWLAYTQQSYWQIFTRSLSRPFRNFDHEPELIYIAPTFVELPGDWRLRYSGISLNHQSNGQSLPLSRSWNRIILMAGLEKDARFTLRGRYWYRIPEDAANDDNPDISDKVGRAELTGTWNLNNRNRFGLTVRHSLRDQANGSYKLEWLKSVEEKGQSDIDNGLRFHLQLFSGYGDSLVDYNRQRTVLSVGFSLVR